MRVAGRLLLWALALALVLVLVRVDRARGFSARPAHSVGVSGAGLHFNRGGGEEFVPRPADTESMWQRLKRFLPGVTRAKIEKSYATPQTHASTRYHVRLVRPEQDLRRHCITRILRYLPDLHWETAAEAVDTAIAEGRSLVRVFGSKSDAEYLVDMLRAADPPVVAEIFDAKLGEITPR